MKRLFVKYIVSAGDHMKPVLVKVLPKKSLKKIKNKLLKLGFESAKLTDRNDFEPERYPTGINLYGYIKSEMGLGEGCRLISNAIKQSGLHYGIIDTRTGNPFNHNDNSHNSKIISKPIYNINVFHINPEQMPHLYLSLPNNTWDKRYNIGIWLWELKDFPQEWNNAFSLVDEIWVPSQFCLENFQAVSPVPVKLIPYGINPSYSSKYNRIYFGIPEDIFTFLIMFDTNSTMERKNPEGAIKAFKRTFMATDKSVGLVIKVNNSTPECIDKIKELTKEYKNIYLITETMPKIKVNSLIKCCDVFVSLHRAEGFGLVIAEAMLLKTAVIATYWSANIDFMSTETACCVDYTLVPIEKDCFMYKKGQLWADPDIIQASVFMKILRTDNDYRNHLINNAYNYITTFYNVSESAKAIKTRVNEILNENFK